MSRVFAIIPYAAFGLTFNSLTISGFFPIFFGDIALQIAVTSTTGAILSLNLTLLKTDFDPDFSELAIVTAVCGQLGITLA